MILRERPVDIDTDVLVVGGGGCGLAASVMLSGLGVDHFLIERHPGTARVPKAHVLNPRTMEIFGQFGISEQVYAAGAPAANNAAQVWFTSLGGDESWHRQQVHRADAWGGGQLREEYARHSAYPHGNTPQIILEPLLRRIAQERAPDRIRFYHELQEFEQDDDGVTALILDRESGREYVVRARFLLGADGGKKVGPDLGVVLEGPEPFVETESVYFRADLSKYLPNDDSVIRFFNRPSLDGQPVRTGLVAAGPDRWDRHCPEWTMSVTLGPDEDRGAFDDERAAAAIRERLNLPELEIEVLAHLRWSIDSLVADRYQVGRVFIAGDAAHRHSPFGGLGLNSGIQDAHNLVWKLATVLSGQAGPALLESYELERRPVASRNVAFATVAFFNTLAASAGFGVLPHASLERNRQVLEEVFSPTRWGAFRRARLTEYFDTMRMEGQAADMELGFEYSQSPRVVPDGTPSPPRDPTGRRYVAQARPGHRLPHAWLLHRGVPRSTHHFVLPGRFTLFVGEDAEGWHAAVERAVERDRERTAGRGFPVEIVQVAEGGEVSDRDGVWETLRGHGPAGAVLVRPDAHIGARFEKANPDELLTALEKVMAT